MTETIKSNVKKYSSALASGRKELVHELRKLILGVVPDFNEVISWGNLSYSNQEKSCLYAISSHNSYLNVHFWRPRNRKIPKVCFEGTGKKLDAYNDIDLKDIKGKALNALVKKRLLN